jgi:colanic acid/amylovoran biosynthesis protein
VIQGDYTPPEIKGMIGHTQLFIGLRMHSNIAALSMQVPTIAIAYGPKAYGIMAMAGQEEYVMNLPRLNVDSLYAMVERAWAHRQETRVELGRSVALVRTMSARNVAIISDLLSSNGHKKR